MTVHEHLRSLRACEKARTWAEQYQTAQEVWDNCDRIYWLFWWAARTGQLSGVVDSAREISDSVRHLNNDAADYAVKAAGYAADYANHATAYAAGYVAADYAAAYDRQVAINMAIARKHLHCPEV